MAIWTTKLFDEIAVGDRATLEHVVDAGDVELIAMLTGDRLALDRTQPAAARSTQAVGARILIANAIGSRLPGPGAAIVEEQLRLSCWARGCRSRSPAAPTTRAAGRRRRR